MKVKNMHADVIIQNPRTAKISVQHPMANEKTSVMEVMKMATEASDMASTIRSFKTSLDLPGNFSSVLCHAATVINMSSTPMAKKTMV